MPTELALPAPVVAALQDGLGAVAQRAVGALAVEVDEYRDQMTGAFQETVQGAVQLALGGFLRLAAESDPQAAA